MSPSGATRLRVDGSGGVGRGLATPDREGRECARIVAGDTSADHGRAGDDDATDDGGIGRWRCRNVRLQVEDSLFLDVSLIVSRGHLRDPLCPQPASPIAWTHSI